VIIRTGCILAIRLQAEVETVRRLSGRARLGNKILTASLVAALICFPWLSGAARSDTRAIIHIPTKSLTSMRLFFGRDKGFFTREGVDVDLVLMSPPTAIASLVAGELDFSTTVGAGISATMRGLPLKRTLHLQHYGA